MAEGARLESVCGGNSTKGSNPFLSANIFLRAQHGARALCIVVLRTVSDPEGSSTKEELGECRRSPGFHTGLFLIFNFEFLIFNFGESASRVEAPYIAFIKGVALAGGCGDLTPN